MATLPPLPEWISLEHDVATILTEQELHGWRFDEGAAWQLECTLRTELEGLERVLRDRHPFVRGSEFTPKRPNRTQGYVQGATFTRLKEFNPTSRDHIAWILQTHYGWSPSTMTQTGKPMIDEVILKEIDNDFAQMCFRCLDLTKKLGLLSEGVNAWLKLSRNSRIHHHCSVATVTHRCAHRKPNLGQVPSEEKFRELFIPSPGLCMVGADLSGIELRMLAHYLARYDSGAYADILLNGDIHQVNADKIGISRRLVKTVTYAFLYGAGDQKIGLSYDSQLTQAKAKAKGKEIRDAYVKAIPGLDDLLSAVSGAADRGFVRSIDGRKITLDSPHKGLNYLLQSGAGVVAKRWMVIANQYCDQNTHQLAFVHDELQYETTYENAEPFCASLVSAARHAGEYYNLRIRIDAEGKIGNNWSDVH
jgi:DNA polymerase I-like protein with 3'-5' exonuclease and polymerase domains